jgi:hypothetical protein
MAVRLHFLKEQREAEVAASMATVVLGRRVKTRLPEVAQMQNRQIRFNPPYAH